MNMLMSFTTSELELIYRALRSYIKNDAQDTHDQLFSYRLAMSIGLEVIERYKEDLSNDKVCSSEET